MGLFEITRLVPLFKLELREVNRKLLEPWPYLYCKVSRHKSGHETFAFVTFSDYIGFRLTTLVDVAAWEFLTEIVGKLHFIDTDRILLMRIESG